MTAKPLSVYVREALLNVTLQYTSASATTHCCSDGQEYTAMQLVSYSLLLQSKHLPAEKGSEKPLEISQYTDRNLPLQKGHKSQRRRWWLVQLLA